MSSDERRADVATRSDRVNAQEKGVMSIDIERLRGRRWLPLVLVGVLVAGLLTVVPGVAAVAAPSNVARAAGVSVSASSQNSSTGQTAVKAVDGSAVGYPGDYTREWATSGGKAGSWIQLTWSSPVTIDRVVLYDRPNTGDQVTAGNLAFSAGAAVSVGSLSNSGAATTVTFSARTVTSVRFNITSVSASTVNVGLSEFEVWGEAGTPTNRPPVATRVLISRCRRVSRRRWTDRGLRILMGRR